jgi:hypothetical protein
MRRALSLVVGHLTASLAPVRHANHSQTRRLARTPRGWQTAHGDRRDTRSPPTEPRLRPRAGRTSQRAASRTHVAVQPKASRP